MDISPFSTFSYSDDAAWQDFLMMNGMRHEAYNGVLEGAGFSPVNYPIFDKGDTTEATKDWLQTHNLMHKALVTTIGLPDAPDLSDVGVHDDGQFQDWLQLHLQQHQLIDLALNL